MERRWVKAAEWPEVILERLEGAGVARIVLNKPEKHNSITQAIIDGVAEALDIIRAEHELKVVIMKGAGPSFSSGLNLQFLRSQSEGYLSAQDWDRQNPAVAMIESIRKFPRIMIAQVHGYCLGGALALANMHDLIVAGETAQFGMPELIRGSFGQAATSTLFHAGLPLKKASLIALTCKNVSGTEADRLGLVSLVVPDAVLEERTTALAQDISERNLAALQHHKIAVQMGVDLSVEAALRIDALVGARQSLYVDPVKHVEEYLTSQKKEPSGAAENPPTNVKK